MPPKRTATTDAGPGPSSKSQATKKTRFASPSQDPSQFEAQVEDALENPSAARKGRVKTEGYDSDSSDDGEGVVFSRRKDGEGGDGDDDEDMFAMAEEAQKGKGKDAMGDGKKKKEEYMRLGDIEGQEFNQLSDMESGEDEDEPEDEDDAERRRKTGMGYEMSKFNMREEMDEGRFSADGMYVRTFDPHAVHDRWMDTVNEREIKKARIGMKKRERAEKAKQRQEAEELEIGKQEDREKELVGLLRKGETVLEALARLGARAKKEKAASKGKAQSKIQAHPDPETQSDIDHLTALASALLATNVDIYSETYESLLRAVRSKGHVDPNWTPPSKDVKYEYRWAIANDSGGDEEREVFGPYGEEEMRAWFGAAYFGNAGENIELRPLGKQWGTWEEVLGS